MEFLIGCDLGQANDYTALCVAERLRVRAPAELRAQHRLEREHLGVLHAPMRIEYHVRELERLRLGMSYVEVADRIVELRRRVPDAALVLDHTGVGRPITDMLRDRGLRPAAVTITAGERAHPDGMGGWRVPKKDLVAVMQRLLQERRLKIAPALPFAETLVQELLNFRVKINRATGNDSYGAWRERDHDDLVLAVACAVWYGERQPADAQWYTLRG